MEDLEHTQFPYLQKLMKSAFKSLKVYHNCRIYKQNIWKIASTKYSNTLKYQIIQVLKINRAKKKAVKKLYSLLDLIYKSITQSCLILLQEDSPFKLKFKTSEYVHRMTSFRISILEKVLASIQRRKQIFVMNCLKKECFDQSSIEIFSYDSPIRDETLHTSAQARSVLLKSENLRKRVDSLAGKLSSQQISQDSCESASPRLNLHIPRVSLTNTPLSPLSMGELDTDRISNKVIEEEEIIKDLEIVIKIWNCWREFVTGKKKIAYNFALAKKFFDKKVIRKIFAGLKNQFLKTKKKKVKKILAGGSYVQRILRKVICHMKIRIRRLKNYQNKIDELRDARLRKIIKSWKKVTSVIAISNFKVRKCQNNLNQKKLKKYFKLFVIISMIVSRENQQKRIAEAYNRERLLKLGFTHISLSVFTNKFHSELLEKALKHRKNYIKKEYFKLITMKTLICKRIRILKLTSQSTFRKNNLLKAMRRLYTFHSKKKDINIKTKKALNYLTSNLILKSFVSWQNYQNNSKEKKKLNNKGFQLFKSNVFTKYFDAWKKWYPKIKNIRLTGESIAKEKKFWILKEYLLEWTVMTKNRIESKNKFQLKKSIRKQFFIFNSWKKYTISRLSKREYEDDKIDKLRKKILSRIFFSMKNFARKRNINRHIGRFIVLKKASKYLNYWRILFQRKITLTPLLLKRNCNYIFQRWKNYSKRTSRKFKLLKMSSKFRHNQLKSKSLSALENFYLSNKLRGKKIKQIQIESKKKLKLKSILLLKKFAVNTKLKRLKREKSKNHFVNRIKKNIFQSWLNYKDEEAEKCYNLTKTWNLSMLGHYGINRSESKADKIDKEQDLDTLRFQFLKSKGLFRWFNYVKFFKHKTNDISSLLSNSFTINITETYFKKESVSAYLDRKKKVAKKIFAVWRQCVDKSKKKFKSVLKNYHKNLRVKLKKIFYEWKKFINVKKNLKKKLIEIQVENFEKIKKKIFCEWNHKLKKKQEKYKKITRIEKKRIEKFSVKIFEAWKKYFLYSITLKKISENCLATTRYKKVFLILKQNLQYREQFLEKRSKTFRLSRIFSAWLDYLDKNQKKSRINNKLRQKSENFYKDLSRVRGLRRLHQYSLNRRLIHKADEFNLKKSLQKGIDRWSAYYFNFLKVMKKAKVFDHQRQQKRKIESIHKWFYFSHLNSWKNRAEKRLFFYWDRRLKRILFTWRNIVCKKYNSFEVVWEFRTNKLLKKSFRSLTMMKSLKQQKVENNTKANNFNHRLTMTHGMAILKSYHQYYLKKLSKLTKALNFCYYKSCSKYLSLWENCIRMNKMKKSRLNKIYNNYLRNYGIRNQNLKDFSINSLKSSNDDNYYILNSFLNSLKSGLPKRGNFYTVGIFLKWRSLASGKTMRLIGKSISHYWGHFRLKVLRAWRKAVSHARSRRKTLRSAIIFHRTKLKKKVFEHMKPKKVEKKKKYLIR